MAGTVFVDESKRSGFRFAAVRVPQEDIADARATMRAQLVRGTRRLHFVHENDVIRRRALAAIAELDLRIAIIESPRFEAQSSQRTAALAILVGLCAEWEADRLVVERDENTVGLDRRVLTECARTLGHPRPLAFTHVPASQEPLLWIADAVAWSWSRGGDYRRRIAAYPTTCRACHS
jgi:hypothetical protein